MSNKKVRVEVCHNINGSLSLCICDNDGGYRISGAKVGGCETLKVFTVDADELMKISFQRHALHFQRVTRFMGISAITGVRNDP